MVNFDLGDEVLVITDPHSGPAIVIDPNYTLPLVKIQYPNKEERIVHNSEIRIYPHRKNEKA